MATKNPRVVTGKVRLSYVYAFQPQVKQDGTLGKYGVAILIPKTDKETIAKINAAFEQAKANSAAYFGGTVPKLLKGGLRDGDLEKEEPDRRERRHPFEPQRKSYSYSVRPLTLGHSHDA